MAVDVSSFQYFLPLLSFLVVFVVTFVVLAKVNLFEGPWVHAFVSFLVATIFVSVADARSYVQNVTPWFAVLLVCLFFMVLLFGLVGKPLDFMQKGVGVVFVIVLFIVFLIAALVVFSSQLGPYLPGSETYGSGNPNVTNFTDWLYSPRVGGAVLLLLVSALVSWVLVKAK